MWICWICTNFKRDVSKDKNVLESMNETLSKRGPDEEGYYLDKSCCS